MPFIFCIYFLQKNKSKDLKAFFLYTILLFISVSAVIIFRYFIKSYSTYLIFYRFFIIGEFSLIALFFSLNIFSAQARKTIRLIIIPFILFSIFDFLTEKASFTYYPLVLECTLFPLIIIYFFYE